MSALNEMIQVAKWQETHKRMAGNSARTVLGCIPAIEHNIKLFQSALTKPKALNIFAAATALSNSMARADAQLQFLLALMAVLTEVDPHGEIPQDSVPEAALKHEDGTPCLDPDHHEGCEPLKPVEPPPGAFGDMAVAEEEEEEDRAPLTWDQAFTDQNGRAPTHEEEAEYLGIDLDQQDEGRAPEQDEEPNDVS
jgi:hypothetical protein